MTIPDPLEAAQAAAQAAQSAANGAVPPPPVDPQPEQAASEPEADITRQAVLTIDALDARLTTLQLQLVILAGLELLALVLLVAGRLEQHRAPPK